MNLTETERLVRRIELYLKQADEALAPDLMARDYAAEHGAATKRLITCQRIIRGGDHAQHEGQSPGPVTGGGAQQAADKG